MKVPVVLRPAFTALFTSSLFAVAACNAGGSNTAASTQPQPADELPPLEFDQYGGLLGFELDATGYFRTEKIADAWWLVTPDGHPFFSAGLNGVRISGTPDKDGNKAYEEVALEKYGDEQSWAAAQIERLRDWGWNTIGSWSDWELFRDRVPYTLILDLSGADWQTGDLPDYFSDEFETRVNERAREYAAPLADDPWLLGYFLDNELRWGPDWRPGHLFDDYMSMATDTAGKAELLDFIESRYANFPDFVTDFPVNVGGWESLAQLTAVPSPSTGRGEQTRADWVAHVARRYFSVTDAALRAADPNHMNLGARFVAYVAPRTALAAAGEFVDVMSVNYYDLIADFEEDLRTLDPEYLTTDNTLLEHYETGGKPLLISEWGYRAEDSGLPNTWPPLYPTLDTQTDRAAAFETYVQALLDTDYVVGHHWFIYIDQPAAGRFDGENNNFGVITEADEPYQEIVDISREMHERAYRRLAP